MSNQSLVLRGLTRHRSGNYKCTGINGRGEGVSNAVQLTVRFAPICRHPVRNIRGAERGEFLNLLCNVDSLPRPLKYRFVLLSRPTVYIVGMEERARGYSVIPLTIENDLSMVFWRLL